MLDRHRVLTPRYTAGGQEFSRTATSKPTLESIPNPLKGAFMLTDTPLTDGVIANLDREKTPTMKPFIEWYEKRLDARVALPQAGNLR